MRKNSDRLLIILMALLIVTMSCSLFGGGGSSADAPVNEAPVASTAEPSAPEAQATEPEPPAQGEPAQNEPAEYDTEFPLPEDVRNFQQLREDLINYQTGMGMDEVVAFYRQEFKAQGLTERTLVTSITDAAFSLVFDGAPNGMSIVIQGFPFDAQTVNVSVRYDVVD